VVTSATRELAAARLGAVGIELPAVVVYAGDVGRGKPDPEGYLTAAVQLGVDPAEALVVEDSPPGVQAGRAAGAATVAVTSTHDAAELTAADVVIGTLEELPAVLRERFDAGSVLA
jgi:sugar-phosphatase